MGRYKELFADVAKTNLESAIIRLKDWARDELDDMTMYRKPKDPKSLLETVHHELTRVLRDRK